jgi:hypothetical protein
MHKEKEGKGNSPPGTGGVSCGVFFFFFNLRRAGRSRSARARPRGVGFRADSGIRRHTAFVPRDRKNVAAIVVEDIKRISLAAPKTPLKAR